MGDVYGYGSSNINPSSSSISPQDEFSLFLHQILLPPSSSSYSAPSSSSLLTQMPKNAFNATKHENAPPSNPAFLSSYIKGTSAANVSPSSVGVSENESDDNDWESEGGTVEATVEEVQAKPVPPMSSYKRTRTAEVHNLSEKRRRSRINEKMKALQNLIPNSNKTDKASMLDEAIEYLKQLQLQVQILSMRNGLSLHPMCFPEGLQPLQLSQMRMYGEESKSSPLNTTATLPLHPASDLPDKLTLPSPSNIFKTSFGLESPIPGHLGPFELTRSSEHQQLNANNSDTNPLDGSQAVQEFESGTLATASLSFDMQTTEVKDNWKHALPEEICQKSF